MIIEVEKNSDFSIHNIPFGVFSTNGTDKRVGVAIGESIVDLKAVAELGVWDFDISVLSRPFLNDFISLGKTITAKVRTDIQGWLKDELSPLGTNKNVFILQADASMHMPVQVGDYTDFYSSIEHATNVGMMFRDPENALLPNWRHLPVGYHGRASSIIVSGEHIHRPKGQVMPKGASSPIYRSSARLDFELEMGFVIGKDTDLGTSVSTKEADDYIFGLTLFNDWSARDIQKWEYVPLGPFLGKSFASSMSPWIVTLEALEKFRVAGPEQNPEVLPYLRYDGIRNYNINLEVGITPSGGSETIICRSNFQYMYWNMAQQLAHHTANGCNIKVGDLMASGTISGKDEHSYGSMLELSWSGTKPMPLNDGSTRTFIEDGDTIIMRGHAELDGARVGFGEVRTEVLPSI
ncbi:MAG: fumarylacetoacetase [Saprospiraceae bacterium]|jgi:fumarylacetoacetase